MLCSVMLAVSGEAPSVDVTLEKVKRDTAGESSVTQSCVCQGYTPTLLHSLLVATG